MQLVSPLLDRSAFRFHDDVISKIEIIFILLFYHIVQCIL